jgi:large subunit ribosomal protein L21
LIKYTLARRCNIYAIIESGGKQFKVAPGQTIDVDRLQVPEGDKVELNKVLLIANGDNVTVGKPAIEGARVLATSKGEAKGKKIVVLRFKAKDHYTKKTGHRQKYTRLTIDEIVGQDKPK